MSTMTRAHLSPLRTMSPAALDTLRRMAEKPHTQPHHYQTIADSDWSEMLRNARAKGADEGNELLRRIRAAVLAADIADPEPVVAPINSRLS